MTNNIDNPEYNKNVIGFIVDDAQNLATLSPEMLSNILSFIVTIENDTHKRQALNLVAQYIISTMSIHILSLMSSFQRNAALDDIIDEHIKETLDEVLPKAMRLLCNLHNNIDIASLCKLYTLCHITSSLEVLFHDNGKEASLIQNSLYFLPEMFFDEIKEDMLLKQ